MMERLILAFKARRNNNGDNTNASPLLNYFRIVFNFGYILFLIPFRLKSVARSGNGIDSDALTVTVTDADSSDVEESCESSRSRSERVHQVELVSNRVHQWICATVHCLIMFEYASMARRRLNSMDLFGVGVGRQDPVPRGLTSGGAFESLQTVGCIACLVYGVAFIYTFWTRRDAWLRAFRLIDEIELVKDGESSKSSFAWIGFKINLLSLALGLMYTVFGCLDTTFEHNFRVDRNLTGFFTTHYAETQEFYFFREYDQDGDGGEGTNAETLLHALTVVLTCVRLAVAVPKFLLIQMLEWTVLMTVLCLRHVVSNFLKLRPRKRSSPPEATDQQEQLLDQVLRTPEPELDIFVHYDRFKQLVKALNSATKVLTFSCIGVALPFYASWIVIVFFEEGVEWRQFAHFYFYFGVFFTLLVLAAEFHAKSIDFYRWIARSAGEACSQERLSCILIDLQCNEVAVKGSAIFVVTYRFIGGFLSVIVTYTIIMLQFQVSRRSRASVP